MSNLAYGRAIDTPSAARGGRRMGARNVPAGAPALFVAAVVVADIVATGPALEARSDVIGVASVIDADTIEIHGQRIRLHGIDALQGGQTCLDAAGRNWPCGQRAALALQDLLGRRTVTCDERDIDRYRRIVGRCLVGEVDINEWLVAQGLALAYRRYSRDYVAAEDEAQAAGRGMWVGSFELPWEWRRRH